VRAGGLRRRTRAFLRRLRGGQICRRASELLVTYYDARTSCRRVRKGFRQNVASAIRSAMLRPVFVGVPLAFRRPIILLGMTAVAAMSLSACGRNGPLELPPGPASIQPAPAALSWPPPGPVAADTSGAGPAGVQPAPAALSGPPPGPVAADASGAPPTQQDTIARTGFDVHGNPAATPGQKKPFFLDPLLQ
jgi:hypothetical protein